jgi:hypothetical protein
MSAVLQTFREHALTCAGTASVTCRGHLRRVWQAITDLPDENREVVILFAAGYEYREIAEMLTLLSAQYAATSAQHADGCLGQIRRDGRRNRHERKYA